MVGRWRSWNPRRLADQSLQHPSPSRDRQRDNSSDEALDRDRAAAAAAAARGDAAVRRRHARRRVARAPVLPDVVSVSYSGNGCQQGSADPPVVGKTSWTDWIFALHGFDPEDSQGRGAHPELPGARRPDGAGARLAARRAVRLHARLRLPKQRQLAVRHFHRLLVRGCDQCKRHTGYEEMRTRICPLRVCCSAAEC